MATSTDQDVLDQLQRAVVEGPPAPDLGVSWPSGLWTPEEVVGYLDQRQQRLLQETLVIAGWLQQALIPNQPIQPLPESWLATQHAMVEYNGMTTPIDPASRPNADLEVYGWQQQMARPLAYVEIQTGTLSWEMIPTPLAGGLLHLFGTWLATTLDGTGITIAVPEDLVPYLYYGTLADMFGKQGRAYNKPLHDYCEERWQEGIAVARAMVEAVTMP